MPTPESLTIWLERDMQRFAASNGKRGHQWLFSDATIQFCLSIKSLFWSGLAPKFRVGRKPGLRLAELDWPVPDYSTISRHQQILKVQLPCRPSHRALYLLLDSTDIKFIRAGLEYGC